VIKTLFAYRNLLLGLLLLNSGCIFLTDDKVAGIPLLREAVLAAVVLSAVLLLVMWKHVHRSRAAAWITLFGVVLPILSAILANLNYGQPFLYGMLEERRSFAYLLFFPVYFLMVKTKPTQDQIERFMLISGLACVFVGFLYYFKVIPENTNISFTVDDKNGGENLLRPDRYRIGANYVSICAFMLMYSIKRRLTLVKVATLCLFALYLWLVLQTRATMIIWALAGIWIFRNRPGLILQMAGFIVAALVATYVIFPTAVIDQYDKFFALMNEATDGDGPRDVTIALTMRDIANNNFVGMGALSLQWENGFARVYNDWFYLSDVGIVGVYYRYGFFTPLIALVYYLGFIRIMRNCKDKGSLLSAFQLDFWFSMINMVLSNSIMYGGEISAIAVAAFLYASKARAPAATQSEYSYHDPISYRHYKPQ
jgi:hypothetical protein